MSGLRCRRDRVDARTTARTGITAAWFVMLDGEFIGRVEFDGSRYTAIRAGVLNPDRPTFETRALAARHLTTGGTH